MAILRFAAIVILVALYTAARKARSKSKLGRSLIVKEDRHEIGDMTVDLVGVIAVVALVYRGLAILSTPENLVYARLSSRAREEQRALRVSHALHHAVVGHIGYPQSKVVVVTAGWTNLERRYRVNSLKQGDVEVLPSWELVGGVPECGDSFDCISSFNNMHVRIL